MTLRNSVVVSIIIHSLIFGSALAFGRHAGVVFPERFTAVQVSLVTPETPEGDAVIARAKVRHSLVSEKVEPEQRPPAGLAEPGNEQPIIQQAGGSADVAEAGEHQYERDETAAGGLRSGMAATEYLGLIEAIERVKKYPRLARERGMEGVVRLRFMVNHSGGIDAVELVKSSGHEILDRASISAVYRAAPMPYVNGWVEMPMRYVLK